ncbi:MAG TPA: FTR1 family protein [Candidatus Udaeobacter sp.]|nr:FTR1 family protein [Candidatus Udaeobacter sp.]
MKLSVRQTSVSILFVLTLLITVFSQEVFAYENDGLNEKVVQTARFINTIPVEYTLGVSKDREVVNWGEYKEAKIYVGRAKAEFKSISGALSEIDKDAVKSVQEGLDALTQQINDRVEPDQIASLSAELSTELLNVVGLSQSNDDTATVIQEINKSLDSYYQKQQQGGNVEEALAEAMNAYALFGPLESGIAAKDQKLLIQMEQKFAKLRDYSSSKPGAEAVQSEIDSLKTDLQTVKQMLTAPAHPFASFLDSLTIILREGFEAILVIGALTSFLIKSDHRDKLKSVYWGAGGAVVASVITAILLQTVFKISGANRETLEGVTMLVAVAILIWISFWLVNKAKGSRWKKFVEGRMKASITTGSVFTLGMTAFFAVYREGFETILFYQAIFSMGSSHVTAVISGLALGLVLLGLVYYLINRYAVKIPMKPYFLATSILLNIMAFRFLGYGIRELQFAGTLNATEMDGMPDLSLLGIYPTVEVVAAQAGLLIVLFIGLTISLRKKFIGGTTHAS